MHYISYIFHPKNEAQSEQLVALLSNIGFEGFEEDDDILKAFVAEDKFDETGFNDIVDLFSSISYEKETVENINWNAQWESGFEPVIINDFAAIRASFHPPVTNVRHEVIITPKMSFGTGHHATTHQMIEQMAALDMEGKTVFDFGTGTAVLAILAEKLGAISIYAIDNDDQSIENGKENITANSCSHINIEKMGTVPTDTSYNIILANINLNVILDSLPALATISKKGAIMLLSGFLRADEETMTKALLQTGFRCINVSEKGGWLCIRCQKQ